jgi:hypothetical protein
LPQSLLPAIHIVAFLAFAAESCELPIFLEVRSLLFLLV